LHLNLPDSEAREGDQYLSGNKKKNRSLDRKRIFNNQIFFHGSTSFSQ